MTNASERIDLIPTWAQIQTNILAHWSARIHMTKINQTRKCQNFHYRNETTCWFEISHQECRLQPAASWFSASFSELLDLKTAAFQKNALLTWHEARNKASTQRSCDYFRHDTPKLWANKGANHKRFSGSPSPASYIPRISIWDRRQDTHLKQLHRNCLKTGS